MCSSADLFTVLNNLEWISALIGTKITKCLKALQIIFTAMNTRQVDQFPLKMIVIDCVFLFSRILMFLQEQFKICQMKIHAALDSC